MGLSADDFMSSDIPLAPAETQSGEISTLSALSQVEKTTKKDYRAAYIYINVTSHSQRSESFHKCPRMFLISKTPTQQAMESVGPTNVDFVFGHSVGAGIQTYLITRNKIKSMFAAFLGWNAHAELEHPKKGKNLDYAVLSVEKFIHFWETNGWADEWELAYFNEKPATELTFFIDCENGSYHAGHIDAVLRNKRTGRYMVLEIKTTAIRNPDEAQYGNSDQTLGYSIVLDRVATDLGAVAEFQVLYLVYSSTKRELEPFPFIKSRAERATWLQDLLVDHSIIHTYVGLNFFPKRGNNCWSFGGRCIHYGLCDMKSMTGQSTGKPLTAVLKFFDRKTMPLPEPVDFEFKLSDLVSAVKEKGAPVSDNTIGV